MKREYKCSVCGLEFFWTENISIWFGSIKTTEDDENEYFCGIECAEQFDAQHKPKASAGFELATLKPYLAMETK